MADVLEANWDSGKTLKDLADEAGFSRQHAANVLDSHFSMIERDETMIEKDEDTNEITVTIPDDVEPSSYLRGVSDALEKAQ